MLEKVIENWTSRLDYIRASRGSHMPEIIFKIMSVCWKPPFCPDISPVEHVEEGIGWLLHALLCPVQKKKCGYLLTRKRESSLRGSHPYSH
ncbi:hypothetical protein TNCV_247351 [Trichonephila clavipes]|nr:hypothetical protein TNCV_247351 [Trichonephila clavipes]